MTTFLITPVFDEMLNTYFTETFLKRKVECCFVNNDDLDFEKLLAEFVYSSLFAYIGQETTPYNHDTGKRIISNIHSYDRQKMRVFVTRQGTEDHVSYLIDITASGSHLFSLDARSVILCLLAWNFEIKCTDERLAQKMLKFIAVQRTMWSVEQRCHVNNPEPQFCWKNDVIRDVNDFTNHYRPVYHIENSELLRDCQAKFLERFP